MPEDSGSQKRRERRGEPSKRRAKPRRELREPEPKVRRAAGAPGPARLYALLAGGGLALLGVLGFFHDAGFGTGSGLDGDDIAGVLIVNGWRNVVYVVTGLLALIFASSHPRAVSLGLGVLYLAFGIVGAVNTSNDIGSLLDALPLTNEDNAFHILLGGIGLATFLADGGLPRLGSEPGTAP